MTHYPVESTELMPEDFYERVFTHGYETYFNQPKPEGLDQSFIWQMKDGERLVAAMNGKIRYQAMEIDNLAIDPDYYRLCQGLCPSNRGDQYPPNNADLSGQGLLSQTRL